MVCCIYVILVLLLVYGNSQLIEVESTNDLKVPVSVLVPFRNEEENLEMIFQCLASQDYPKALLEVIFINDHSDDDGCDILEELLISHSNFKIISNTGSGKKSAIGSGVNEANHNLIVTTDADCSMTKKWVSSIVSFYEKTRAHLVVGPVKPISGDTWLKSLLNLEFVTLISSTTGAIGLNRAFMCNGANLCFSRRLFMELNPYKSNKNESSGDDVFLLHTLRKEYGKESKVVFANSKDALVQTKQVHSFLEFINQRIRWAKKSTMYKDAFTIFIGLIVLLMNLSILYLLIISFIGEFRIFHLLLIFTIKFLVDFALVQSVPKWLKGRKLFINSFLISLIYPIYVALIALLSLVFRPVWKGRKI